MSEETIQDQWPEEGTYCWGCGKNNEHGLQLKSHWEGDETVATFTPKEYHLAFSGVLNGGIIATIIDCHATGTANALAHREAGSDAHFMYVTASLYVKYLRPTPLDKPVSLRARIKKNEGKRITVECDLYSGDKKCATGELVAVKVDQEIFMK